jgi:hypothetical protein
MKNIGYKTVTDKAGIQTVKPDNKRRGRLLFQMLKNMHDREHKSFKFKVDAREVCQPVFCSFMGCSNDIYRYMAMLNDDPDLESPYKENVHDVDSPHLVGPKRKVEKALVAEAWIRVHAMQVGDHMPHDNKTVVPRIPQKLYHQMYLKQTDECHHIKSEDYFHKMWEAQCPEIVLARDKGTHATCTACAEFAKMICATNCPHTRAAISERRHEHLNEVMAERKDYHKRVAEAEQGLCYSIIIDAWDQSKTNIPWPGERVKATDQTYYVLKYVGVIVHGYGRLMFSVDHSVSEGDADLTTEVIRRVLLWMEGKDLMNKGKALHFQFDNASDNKNKTICAVMDWIATKGWFSEVYVHPLVILSNLIHPA